MSEYYNVVHGDYDIKRIPIKQIDFDVVMARTLDERWPVWNTGRKYNVTYNPHITGDKLTRLTKTIREIENNDEIYPVKLNRKYYRNKIYYEIVDGRHRVAASVAHGYKYVPAIIMNDDE